MTYICVAHWDASTKAITGENSRETEAEAAAVVYNMIMEGDGNAFYSVEPDTDKRFWVVNEDTLTVEHSQAREDAAAATLVRDATLEEISILEKLETPRRMAEAVMLTALTNDPVYPAATNGKLWLEANRAAIATKRATL